MNAPAATATAFRVPLLGMFGGALGGLGCLILMQQYEVAYPTRGLTIAFVVGGALTVLGVAAAVTFVATRRSPAAPGPASTAPTSAPEWVASHEVPEGGLSAWLSPGDQARPAARLDGGLAVAVDEIDGDWAHVRCSNGWRAWVDRRALTSLAVSVTDEEGQDDD